MNFSKHARMTIPEEQEEKVKSYAPEVKLSWFRRVTDRLFGYDYFISYAWDDGRTYAVELHRRLESSGFNCFLDSSDFVKGGSINEQGRRALRKTSRLVVVATPKSLESEYVLLEVRNFTQLKRAVIPIGFESTFSKESDSALLDILNADKLRINEIDEALLHGPSPHVTEELRESFNLLRQEEKRVHWFAATAMLFLALAILAGWLGYAATQQKKAAEKAFVTLFMRTIGVSGADSSSSDETSALWELSELPESSHRVREGIVDFWISDTATFLRAARGNGRGKRAAMGINYDLYSKFQQNEVVVARGFAERLASPLSEEELGELNRALIVLSEGWDSETTQPVITQIKTSIRESPQDIVNRNEFVSLEARIVAIGNLSRKLSPSEAGIEAVDLLSILLTSGFDSRYSSRFLVSFRTLMDHVDADSKKEMARVVFPHLVEDHGYNASLFSVVSGIYWACCEELDNVEAFDMAKAVLERLKTADDDISDDLFDVLSQLHVPLTPDDSIELNKRILADLKEAGNSPEKQKGYKQALLLVDESIPDEEMYTWIKPVFDVLSTSEHLDVIVNLTWVMSERTLEATPEFTNRLFEMLLTALEGDLDAKDVTMAGEGLADLSEYVTESERTKALGFLESRLSDFGLEDRTDIAWAIDQIKGVSDKDKSLIEIRKGENHDELIQYLADSENTESKTFIVSELVDSGWKIRNQEDVEVARNLINEIPHVTDEDSLVYYMDALLELCEVAPPKIIHAVAAFAIESVSRSSFDTATLSIHDQNYALADLVGRLGRKAGLEDRLHLLKIALAEMKMSENHRAIQGLEYVLEFLSEEPSRAFALPAVKVLFEAVQSEREYLTVSSFAAAIGELGQVLEFGEMKAEVHFLIQKLKGGDGSVRYALGSLADKIPASLAIEGATGFIDFERARVNRIEGASYSSLQWLDRFLEKSGSAVRNEVMTHLVEAVASESLSLEGDRVFLSDAAFTLATLSRRFGGSAELTNFAVSQMLTQSVEGDAVASEYETEIEDYRLGFLRSYCSALSVQELAEFLKWPVCVGAAEKIALAEIERKLSKMRREPVDFKGQLFLFLKQAKALGIRQIKKPVERPRVEDALESVANLFGESFGYNDLPSEASELDT
ncbi:MAG: hypothetical protein CMO55_14410 [Verrucomicrobiales bacterium]|nr:hypothetical protein [Verrucomicrobiales bacterium]